MSQTQQTVDIQKVKQHRIACDGGGGALGHPRVWLELGADERAECPYCGKQFVLSLDPTDDHEGRPG